MIEPRGEYHVIYKSPRSGVERSRNSKEVVSQLNLYRGKCENFNPNGTCAFHNKLGETLLVDYKDIVQMKMITMSEE